MSTRLFLAPLLLSSLVAVGCAAGGADPQAQDEQDEVEVGPESEVVTAKLAKQYGGPHLDVALTKTGGNLTFDCASGWLSAPLRLDAKGRFTVSGTFQRSSGMRPIAPEVAQVVQFKGQVTGSKMTIRFAPDGVTQRFTLNANAPATIYRCM